MEIKYSPTYLRSTKYICIHHEGGTDSQPSLSAINRTASDVNETHRVRWSFLSSLWWYGGYNFFINKFGEVTQFRAIGEETAAQYKWNFNGVAISICLAGNFTKGVDVPTYEQTVALKNLVSQLPLAPIVPHRKLGVTKCYGDLADDWAESVCKSVQSAPVPVVAPTELSQLQLLLDKIKQLIASMQLSIQRFRLGKNVQDCHGDNRG